MAIRIDLLPRYVGLRRWFKRILLVCFSLVGAFAAILFVLFYREQLRLQTLKENRDAYDKIAKQADEATEKTKSLESEAKPYQDNINFFVDAGRTGPERAALLDTVHRYIYNGAVISALDLSDGQTIKFTAMVKTPDEYANFLNNLRRGTAPAGILFADLPAGSGPGGWPNANLGASGQNGAPGTAAPAPAPTPAPAAGAPNAPAAGSTLPYIVFPISVNASGKLREPVVVPVAPGETAAAPTNGAPGAPGTQTPPPTP